jgi:hypothetical protein
LSDPSFPTEGEFNSHASTMPQQGREDNAKKEEAKATSTSFFYDFSADLSDNE